MAIASGTTASLRSQPSGPLDRVTAGEALHHVVRALTEYQSLDRVLDAILVQSRAMLAAAESYIMLLIGDRLTLRAAEGLVPGAGARHELRRDEGIEGLVVASGASTVVSDVHRDPRAVDPFDRAAPIGAMICVPLVLRRHMLGVLVATRTEPGPFAEVERWWLEIFAGLAASAIASDLAYQAQERRARQAEMLLELGLLADDVNRTLPDGLFEAVAGVLNGSRAELMMADETKAGAAPDRDGPIADVQQPMLVSDVRTVPILAGRPSLAGARSLIAVPVQVRGAARGVLRVTADEPGRFDAEDLAFLTMIAARIGLLVERNELARHQREVERQQAQTEARQEFLGIVSHELKTPVAVMRAYTELLVRRAERAGRTEELEILQRMDDQADRMLTMIEQLLDLRRLEAGLIALEESHFDLRELVQRVARGIQLTTEEHKIRVQAERKMVVHADRRRIEEVLTNLLDNAIKYSPAGGEIVVRIRPEPATAEHGERVVVSVRDRGIGIALPDQARVFERFYQAGARQLHKGHAGLGLGLYVSRELIRRHGGDMWLESTEGSGSTFYFSLPASGPDGVE